MTGDLSGSKGILSSERGHTQECCKFHNTRGRSPAFSRKCHIIRADGNEMKGSVSQGFAVAAAGAEMGAWNDEAKNPPTALKTALGELKGIPPGINGPAVRLTALARTPAEAEILSALKVSLRIN